MRVDVLFTPQELGNRGLGGRVVGVIDVLRATSTIVEAIANGARAVFPAADIDTALRLAQTLGREDVLLCGERRARKIEGFQLGNSPAEFTSAAVADKLVVMTTTNGTPALVAGSAADRCIVASFLNITAAVNDLATSGKPVVLLCAGREGRFSLDDALCAGAMIRLLRAKAGQRTRMNDAAQAVIGLERRYRAHMLGVVRRTSAGRPLADAGLETDIPYCLTHDRHDVVPVMADRKIIRAA